MGTEKLLTFSVITLIGTSAILWALTTGLVTYYAELQKAILLSRLDPLFKTKLKSEAFQECECFIKAMKNVHLEITTIPDVVTTFRSFRFSMLALLTASLIIILVPFFGSIISGNNVSSPTGQPHDPNNPIFNLLAIFTLVLNFGCILTALLFPPRIALKQVAGDLTQWESVKKTLLEKRKP